MNQSRKVRVAIVCDWLTGIGGAERVVLELHRMFPSAPIYTSQYDAKKLTWFKDADVRTTWLQRLPKGLKKFMPVLRIWAFGRLNLTQYDLIISSSGAEAKGIKRLKPGALHISYCHAPTHYYWSRYNEYMKHPGFGIFNPLARLGLILLVLPLRRWDHKAAQRPHVIIANSTHTQKKIKEYYGRESTVIHPPVDTRRFAGPGPEERKGFVTAGRQTPYKRIDLPVAAATKIDAHLTVIGNGADHAKLRRMAGASVTFLTNVSDDAIREDFQAAQAFIFPNVDDFGITAVEAMAAGTPVIAFNGGGARDYVIPGQTGLFFNRQTVDSLAQVMARFNSGDFNSSIIRRHAASFSVEAFHRNMRDFIQSQFRKKRP
jgi:glycosyltransferase involved in cell wall biosynthesis